jgi:acylphosphatase
MATVDDRDIGFRFIVSGKVQGVFFRASAAREATRLGLRGHAINLADGRVEVLAIGRAGAVDEMRRWLGRGPPAARVDGVHASPAGTAGVTGFRTG